MNARVVTWLVTLGLAWGVGAPPARACSYANVFMGAIPANDSELPSGDVYVALHYVSGAWALEHFSVVDSMGEEIPFTGMASGDGTLLHFDTTGAGEVSVFGPTGWGTDLLVTYGVSADVADLSEPSSPVVVVGEPTCEACPQPIDSCCSRPDTDGYLNTRVSISTTQEGMILGWTNDGVHLAGVLTRAAYQSAPVFSGASRSLPEGADIVAMSVAGVLSPSVTWALGDTGPCEVEYPNPTVKDGCVACPGGDARAPGLAFVAGLLVLSVHRRRALRG